MTINVSIATHTTDDNDDDDNCVHARPEYHVHQHHGRALLWETTADWRPNLNIYMGRRIVFCDSETEAADDDNDET